MNGPEDLFDEAYQAEEQGNYHLAWQYLLTAALAGDACSQINLGNYYAEGKACAKDSHTARYWYERAFLNGARAGAHNLGIDFRNSGDFLNATVWLKRAADMDDGDACVSLAELLLNPKERVALLKKALALPSDDISEEAREQAETMLAEVT